MTGLFRNLRRAGEARGIAMRVVSNGTLCHRELAALYVASVLMGMSFTLYNVLLPNIVGLLSEPHERPRNFSNASLVGSITMFAGPLLAGIAIAGFGTRLRA